MGQTEKQLNKALMKEIRAKQKELKQVESDITKEKT